MTDTYSNDYKGEQTHQIALKDMYNQLRKSLEDESTLKIGDAFSNPQLDLGIGTQDPTALGLYPQARTLTWNLQRIEAVLRADPFVTRALEWRSSKPLINGIDISSDDIDSERLEKFQKTIKKKLNSPIKNGFFEGDAFGWSGLLIVIDGQMNKQQLKKPLKPEDIKKGKFLGIKPLTRWYQINHSQKMISELGEKSGIYDPELLGTPLYYNVSFDGDKGNLLEVHRSRLIIVERNKLSYIEKKVEHYGGTSILEQAFESLTRYHNLVAQVHRILQKSVIPILKMEDLAVSALQNEKAQETVENKINMIRKHLSSHNMLVIGEEDTLEFVEATLNNLDKQLQEARIQVSASLNTPRCVIFLEETDDEDKHLDFIKERQDFKLREIYEKLLPMLYKSEYDEEMPEYTLKFKSLETITTVEMAEARKLNVEALEILWNMGSYDRLSVMNTLPDIDNNPHDVFRNLSKDYRKHVESESQGNNFQTKQTDDIMLAEALNKMGGNTVEEKQQGKQQGGNPKSTKKPTPDLKINQDKKKEG